MIIDVRADMGSSGLLYILSAHRNRAMRVGAIRLKLELTRRHVVTPAERARIFTEAQPLEGPDWERELEAVLNARGSQSDRSREIASSDALDEEDGH